MKVAIIGGGLGGLFTGAILAKEGIDVTVLEKNATLGGGLQTFSRFGEDFDTGMHIIGGMHEGGNIRRLCDYLGITDKMRIREVDADCTDELFFLEDDATYRLAHSRDGFTDSLCGYFPNSRKEISNYVDAVYAMADSFDLFNLRPSSETLHTLPSDALLPADGFIAKYVGNEKLRSVLAYMNTLYGGEGGKTPAFVHTIISTLYIAGGSRFVDGSDKMASTLASVITSAGGTTRTRCHVSKLIVENGRVACLLTESGERVEADYYISAIHPYALSQMIVGKAFTKAFLERLENIPDTYSAFSLFFKMKPESFPYINHSVYITKDYKNIWNFAAHNTDWPMGLLFMTPPVSNQGSFSRKVLVTVPMRYDAALRWENTKSGCRGEDYIEWKQQCADKVIELIERIYPGFSDAVECMNTASPLTIRDFYGSRTGSIAGYSKDCHNIMFLNMQVVTKVKNLLLTGQNVNLHGFCGVPLTAISTSEAILGRNYVINKINNSRTR